MVKMTYAEAAKLALAEEMRRDPLVWAIGEDLGRGARLPLGLSGAAGDPRMRRDQRRQRLRGGGGGGRRGGAPRTGGARPPT